MLLANRQAEQLLQAQLGEGMSLRDHLGPDWAPLVSQVEEALGSRSSIDAPVEHTVGGRRVTAQHARLAGPLGGVVVALTDVTDMSRAERVLAWGEMARQVAHEIKNPLTPMRLGMQHLQRAWEDGRADYDRILTETSDRMLGEIDRLDRIARAFSRFAAPGDAEEPLEPIDVVAVAREVAQLYDLSDAGARVILEAPTALTGRARPDELKEVLVNVLENARNAGATLVRVADRAGAHSRRGRWLGYRGRRAAAGLRAALLHQYQRIGPRPFHREAAGGELGRRGGHQQRGRAGYDDHDPVPARLIAAFGTAARAL